MAKSPYLSMRIGEVMPIGLRYSAPDLNDGETISSIVVTVAPGTGLTLSGSPSDDGDVAYETVTAVAAGQYTVKFTTTMSSGLIAIDDYIVKVRS